MAIYAAQVRGRPHEQARRIAPPPKPLRRFIGPLVIASLCFGTVAFTLVRALAPPAPSPPAAATAPRTDAVPDAPAEVAVGANAPPALKPDPRALELQRLREAVFGPFRQMKGRFGIVVKDLGSGHTVVLNEHFPFQAASLYKLPVMYEVFKQREEGTLAFGEELTIGPDDAAMDLGSLIWPIGTRITLGTALERMVTLSDNSSAFMLTKRVGTSRINDDAKALDLHDTHIIGEDIATSAADMAKFLEMVATGALVDQKTSAEMVHVMARQQVRNRIPVLLPPEATVANKTGNWNALAHDVGIVYGPRSTFVIALLSEGVAEDLDTLYGAMAWATRNVYDVTNDPTFNTSPTPKLPPQLVASYTTAARVPAGAVAPRTEATVPSAAPPRSATSAAPAIPAAPTAPPAPPTTAPAPAAPPPPPAPTRPAATAAPALAPPTPAAKPAAPVPTAPPSQPASKPTPKPLFQPPAIPTSAPAPQPTAPPKPQ
ncbi:MAG: serine hydrolase [Chloroflexota bacterium]